jgi:hypothetical protein
MSVNDLFRSTYHFMRKEIVNVKSEYASPMTTGSCWVVPTRTGSIIVQFNYYFLYKLSDKLSGGKVNEIVQFLTHSLP